MTVQAKPKVGDVIRVPEPIDFTENNKLKYVILSGEYVIDATFPYLEQINSGRDVEPGTSGRVVNPVEFPRTPLTAMTALFYYYLGNLHRALVESGDLASVIAGRDAVIISREDIFTTGLKTALAGGRYIPGSIGIPNYGPYEGLSEREVINVKETITVVTIRNGERNLEEISPGNYLIDGIDSLVERDRQEKTVALSSDGGKKTNIPLRLILEGLNNGKIAKVDPNTLPESGMKSIAVPAQKQKLADEAAVKEFGPYIFIKEKSSDNGYYCHVTGARGEDLIHLTRYTNLRSCSWPNIPRDAIANPTKHGYAEVRASIGAEEMTEVQKKKYGPYVFIKEKETDPGALWKIVSADTCELTLERTQSDGTVLTHELETQDIRNLQNPRMRVYHLPYSEIRTNLTAEGTPVTVAQPVTEAPETPHEVEKAAEKRESKERKGNYE